MWLVVCGLAIHLVFFYSIFDIYFTSPLVHGMSPHVTPAPAPARRLVLFVTDGLRADKFFELEPNGLERAPYLRSVIEKRGVWGVSHTRVPTESRPGHVALIAGFYEDVSAVAKGWKENPVEFDSVFNESRYTWSWGSPDILPMFAHGASGDHVFTHCYSAEMEDFAGFESYKLDTWVFNRVQEFLTSAKENQSLSEMLHSDRIVFFLHLLGLDTNGHSRKPYSREYISNIRVVDDGVDRLERLIEDFYKHDGRTAYVLSSDHGMTNWGSHGAGHPSETLTPLVAWGAGLRAAQPNIHPSQHYTDTFSKDWKLGHVKRVDVEQADVAPLMASLIGIPFPLNSVGRLPVDYLEGSEGYKAESLFTNALQILAQFKVKMAQKKHSTLPVAFRPYQKLLDSDQIEKVRHIRNLIQAGQYQSAIDESEGLISLSLEGLNYYQTYDRVFLGFSIASGFLGWMAYILVLLLEEYSGVVRPADKLDQLNTPVWRSQQTVTYAGLSLAVIIIFLLAVQSSPLTYYAYCLIPVVLWTCVFHRRNSLRCVVGHVVQQSGVWGRLLVCVLSLIAATELLVWSFFQRELLSVGLVAMAGWLFTSPVWGKDQSSGLGWLVCCLVLSVFPLLPVVGKDTDYNLVLLSGCVSAVLGVVCIKWLDAGVKLPKTVQNNVKDQTSLGKTYVLYLQIVLIVTSTILVCLTSSSIADRAGLPLTNQIVSWCILGLSMVLPLLCVTDVQTRLLSIALSFLSPYLLMSIRQEGLFYVALCLFLYYWTRLEYTISQPQDKLSRLDFRSTKVMKPRSLEGEDIRRAYFFVFLILLAFFGTGNIASINSFDPASVYCFITVFNPFLMGALIMLKNVIPFVLVTCTFSGVHVISRLPTRAFFLMVFLISDLLALHFFFLVKDYGSWLDIGTSISHYVIVMSMIIFVVLLFGVSHALTHWTLRKNLLRKHHQ